MPELEFESYMNRETFQHQVFLKCRECQAVERERISLETKTAMRSWIEVNNAANRRQRALRLARVAWRDVAEIQKIYADARQKSRESGELHDVDHLYPLQSAYCCGLHVHQNLRVIKASVNRRKRNVMPLHDSPAIKLWIRDVKKKGA